MYYNASEILKNMEIILGRLIKIETSGKTRTYLSKTIVISLRELAIQNEINETTRDIAAYIGMALKTISDSIEESVTPWEKRGYWVKADRFRLEWEWTNDYSQIILEALNNEEWGILALKVGEIGEKLKNINVSHRHRMGKPWVGSYKKYTSINNQ